jgi:hypothetical protein
MNKKLQGLGLLFQSFGYPAIVWITFWYEGPSHFWYVFFVQFLVVLVIAFLISKLMHVRINREDTQMVTWNQVFFTSVPMSIYFIKWFYTFFDFKWWHVAFFVVALSILGAVIKLQWMFYAKAIEET